MTENTERTYVYDLVCPHCGKTSQTTQIGLDKPPPKVNCGDCLMEHTEVVEFKITKVEVLFALAALLAVLAVIPAQAQQATVYGPDGRVQAHVATGSNGVQTVYGPDGRASCRERV